MFDVGVMKRAGLRALLLIAVVAVVMLMTATVLASSYTVSVSPPNGTDDTAKLQAGLDDCVRIGSNCTVQLAAGNYLTKQLVAYNFHGTFKGKGKSKTIIEALPNLPVHGWNDANTIWWPPNTTDHTWPDLIIFVDGDIRVSDMAIKITAIPATQTYFGLPFGAFQQLLGGVLITGQDRTKASIERVSIEGTPDQTNVFGFNVINGLYMSAVLPKSPKFNDAYPFSGTLAVSSSSVNNPTSGTTLSSGGALVKDSHLILGGSPSTGNVFENVWYAIDLEGLENSVVEASYNVAAGDYAGLDVLPFHPFLPKPSLFLIHNNTFKPTGPNADGIILVDDPANKWIYTLIYNNTVEAQNIGHGGISAYSTRGTTILNNKFSGNGGDGIGIWDGTYAAVLGNHMTNFTASPDLAQIVLDGTTTHSTVVCKTPNDTVQNLGTDNKLIGCQAVGSSINASKMSSRPSQPMLKGKPPVH